MKEKDGLAALHAQNLLLIQCCARIRALQEEAERREAQINNLTEELDRTNKGTIALYKELDENKVELLRRTEELERASKAKDFFWQT